MKDFPQESIRQAREIVEKYRRRTRARKEIAADIYDRKFYEIGYGFDEAIETGNCGMFLHEAKKEVECYAMAGIVYLLAREAGLKPKIYLGLGMKDFREGQREDTKAGSDHGFVVCETGKNTQTIIDPFMSLFGDIKIDQTRNLISINQSKGVTSFRKYEGLKQLSLKEYLAKMQKARTPEGGKQALTSTQRVSSRGRDVYIKYLEKTHQISSALRFNTLKFSPESYNRNHIIEIIADIKEDGTIDFPNGDLSLFYTSAIGWDRYENPQEPLVIPVRDAQRFWRIAEAIMKENGRKSLENMSHFKLLYMLNQLGFKDDFSVKRRSEARRAVERDGLEQDLEELQDAKQRTIEDFVERAVQDEITHRTLLRSAQYSKRLNEARKQGREFVYTEEEHTQLLEEGFQDYKAELKKVIATILEQTRIRAGLKKGSPHLAKRKINAGIEMQIDGSSYFSDLGLIKRHSFKPAFSMVADKEVCFRQFNPDMPLPHLEQGISQEDLKRAAEMKLFSNLTLTAALQYILLLKKYQRGLKKILQT